MSLPGSSFKIFHFSSYNFEKKLLDILHQSTHRKHSQIPTIVSYHINITDALVSSSLSAVVFKSFINRLHFFYLVYRRLKECRAYFKSLTKTFKPGCVPAGRTTFTSILHLTIMEKFICLISRYFEKKKFCVFIHCKPFSICNKPIFRKRQFFYTLHSFPRTEY